MAGLNVALAVAESSVEMRRVMDKYKLTYKDRIFLLDYMKREYYRLLDEHSEEVFGKTGGFM